jgi:DNA-binding response OmpR family regulator/tetratricopeptide (TPR) repeat protein
VVDGDAGFRTALLEALAARGVQAFAAETGREALASFDRFPASVLVVSAQLPDWSGFDLARTVQRQIGPSNVSVVIITDVEWGPSQRAAAVQQMGLYELLVKPVEPAAVAEVALSAARSRIFPATAESDAESPTAKSRRPAVEARATPDSASLADPAMRKEQRDVERAAEVMLAGAAEIRGNLSVTPFPHLLHTLYRRRATGALFMLRDTVKKIVYFKEGHPTFVKSNLLSECLGKVLVREGIITEVQCKESLRRMKESRRQQGTVLIEMRIISPQNLVVGLEIQLRAKLLDIFSWTRGEYLFKSDAKSSREVVQLDVSTAALITEGIRSHWDQARLEEALAPLGDRYVVPNSDPELRFQELSLTEDEQALVDAVDGVRTLRQLLADTPLPRWRALAVAYALVTAGAVELRDQPSADLAGDGLARPSRVPDEPLRAQLASQLLSLRQRDAYGVLGVSTSSSDAAIEQAYSGLAREYHPDRFRTAPAEVRALADEIFGIIYQAYGSIATGDDRSRYRRRLTAQELERVSAKGGEALRAEMLRDDAVTLIAAEQWHQARRCLDEAVALCPTAGDLLTLHGWATYREDPGAPGAIQRAIRSLKRSVVLDPKQSLAYLCLGRIYSAMGKAILAEKQFEKALQCDPSCAEALEELRVQRQRRPPRRGPRSY